jgi:hypothetical protein
MWSTIPYIWYLWVGSSSFSIVTRLRAGQPGFDSRQGQRIFLLVTASRPALGRAQPPIQWLPGALPQWWSGWGVKLTTHLHVVPRLRMCGYILPLPHTSSRRGTYLSTDTTFRFACSFTVYVWRFDERGLWKHRVKIDTFWGVCEISRTCWVISGYTTRMQDQKS